MSLSLNRLSYQVTIAPPVLSVTICGPCWFPDIAQQATPYLQEYLAGQQMSPEEMAYYQQQQGMEYY